MFGRGIIGCEPITNIDQHSDDTNASRTRTTGGAPTTGGMGDSRTRTPDGAPTSGGTGDTCRTCTKRGAPTTAGMGDNFSKRRNILLKPSFFQSTLAK